MTVTLHFHGAAGTVTGSCYRLVHPRGQFLVDCGLFQGTRTVRELNLKPFPFDPAKLDFVLLTHAHIDHAGLLPKLARFGFRKPVHTTGPTARLLDYLLPDAAGIQESEAERENRKRGRRDEGPVEPIYGLADAETVLGLCQVAGYAQWVEPGPGVRLRFWNAGHILGSASIEVEVADGDGKPVRLLFSGDIGPDEKVFHLEPDGPANLDYIICESTYGGRERKDDTLVERREALRQEIVAALARGGNLIVPTFAVERSQELLHDIGVLIKEGAIDPQVVFLDSPLASRVTGVYRENAAMFEDVELGADQLFADPRFRIIESVDDSKAINAIRGGAIIMSASGMCDAGRIKHHLRANLPRRNATVLFVGYQAPGTLGQVIQSGAREVRIHSHVVPVRATIRSLGGYSAHADHSELMAWIAARLPAHGALFLTHGEDDEREALRDALVATAAFGGDQVILPLLDDWFELRAEGVGAAAAPAERRIDLAQVASDWHNAYAQLVIALGDELRAAPDERARLELIERLKRTLGGVATAQPPRVTHPGQVEVLHAEPGGE